MKITNVRVLNNYKVKLTNSKLTGVNSSQSSVFEQGTRTPVIITETPTENFQEKFDRVFNYLISRYEPGWSAATPNLGRVATMELLGVSSSINPLILGGTVETAFNYTTGNRDEGWFDPLTHPKDFASAVRSAYKKFERARSPQRASNKFVQYNLNGIYSQDFMFNGGNAFFGYHPNFDWYPGNSLPHQIHMGFSANYDNCIRRSLLHSPYGKFGGPMNSLAGNWRSYPWLSDRYTAESFQFDMYLMLRENTTVRDLLSDHTAGRSAELGVSVDGVVDANLNTLYRGSCFDAGVISIVPFNDYGRTGGGYSADRVLVGSPWIRFPDAITYSSWWGNANERAGLCFHYDSLLMFNGSTFPSDPQNLSDLTAKPPMSDVVGLSYGYGERLLESLNQLSETWGNSMEFIAYLGCLPYGTGFEMRIPFALYKDPTIEGNKEYFKWRLDASVSHWKEKFKSPFDGFAHIVMDASAVIERTYHRWQEPGFTLWTNIASSGASYVENIPVEWARDQYNYTFGNSVPNADKGVVLGIEKFAEYMFKDDIGLFNPNRNDQRRFAGDTNPRHWCLDDDKACDLFSTANDMLLGQRKWGMTYSNSIWGMGVCGSSELGEIFAVTTPDYLPDTSKSIMSAFSCFYNTFIEVENDGDIKWKRVPGTIFNNSNDGVPWIHDRRFRLFYLYPTMLALNMTVVDHFHDGIGYYNHLNKSGWYDKTLGIFFEPNMEQNVRGTVVSNFPYPNRRTPTKPPQNFWTGNARTSEFELLYACMKGGITEGLDSLYFNELHEELVNGLIEPPDTSRTGFFRALDFAVFAVSWLHANTGPDGESLYPTIVPLVHPLNFTSPTVDQETYRYESGDAGNTLGLTADHFEGFKNLCEQLPFERRVVLPRYWLTDGPPGPHRNPHYYFKRTADGTTYTGSATGITFLSTDYGGTWQYGDTQPLRFLTPWAYENRSVAKQSFLSFLQQCKNVGVGFKYLHDDSEAYGDNFSFGSPFFSLDSTDNAIINFATGTKSFLYIPDARSTEAIVKDSRFNGITCSRTNRTFAQEFKHNYNEILTAYGLGSCGASAETILSYFTGATGRSDFRYGYNGVGGFNNLRILYGWNAANYIFCQGDLKSKIIGESLHETTGFENCKVTSSELCTVSAAEGKYGTDLGGHPVVHPHIDGYGHSTHSFGELFAYLFTDYGYPPSPSTDPDIKYGKLLGWHPVSEDGITFSSRSYQAVISDLRKVRSILRSRPQALTEGLVVLINGGVDGNGSFSSVMNDSRYFLEHIYHHCLSGIDYFVVFNKFGNMSLVNQALVEWKNVSGNVVATPCDSTGSTAGLVDRIDLYEVGTNMLVSGAYTNDSSKRLWRITVPPDVSRIVKQGTSQPSLPDTIDIPNESRGVWLEAPASYGVPLYQSVHTRTGFFRALDFAVFGSSYKQYTDTESTPSIVPMLRPTSVYFRGNPNIGVGFAGANLQVNNTGGLPSDQYLQFKILAEQIPLERRVLMPTYWLLDGPPGQRRADYFWKKTSDGTTYGSNIPGKTYASQEFGGTYQDADTVPLRFSTIWAYENRNNAKESFQNFLKQAKNDGLFFSQLQDDSETGGPFGYGSFYDDQTPGNTAAIDAFAQNVNYLQIPDARAKKAMVLDPRFRGITSSITGRSFAEEFEFHYNQFRLANGSGVCGASAETILNSYLTDITDRFDFTPLYEIERDKQYQWYAWNSAIYTFWHGDLKTKIIGGACDDEPGFESVLRGSADVHSMSAAESKFAVDLYGHQRAQVYIPGYGHVCHSYGQISGGKLATGLGEGGFVLNYGYPPSQSADDDVRYGKSFGWHPVSEGGITFGNSAYQAFISDIRRVRGILRSKPDAYLDGMYTWVVSSLGGTDLGYSGGVFATQFYEGNCYAAEYYKEHIFHLCLNGMGRFNPFNVMPGIGAVGATAGSIEINTPRLLNECLVEWREVSGNTVGSPCTNSTATVGATVDRIDLFQAGTNLVISGAMTTNPTKRLWRITVPPGKNTLTRTNATQTNLPPSMLVPTGSRGVWIEAPESYGMPEYQSS